MNWTRRFTRTLEAFVIPTYGQVVGSVVLSLVILVVTHFKLLATLLARETYVPESDLSAIVTSYLVRLNDIENVERIVNATFWAVVAFGAYVIYILISNLFIETVNDYVMEKSFVHKIGGLWGKIHSLVARVGWAVVLFFTFSTSMTKLMPVWLNWAGRPFYEVGAPWWLFLAALAGLAANIYVIWMLVLAVFEADW